MNELAVIFDMDGVLVDTYRAHLKSWQVAAAEVGLSISQQQFAATFGRTSREAIGMLWGDRKFSDQQVAQLDDAKELAFRAILADDFPHMAGAAELLTALHREGFSLAIGSSAPPENVELVLAKMKMQTLFDAVVTGADVRYGKPDPQVFLTAAGRLPVPPQRCVVVEDAAAGVAAARAADMAVIGLASTGRTRQSLASADLVVDRLMKLSPDRLRQIILDRLARCEEN